ncbi:Decarboxylase tropJ [Exophiala dermatitidis]
MVALTADKQQLLRDFISGSHILHYHGVLDAYGHLSVRNPTASDRFIMPRNLAPALLSSEADLVEYFVADAEPVDPSAPNGYVERYIHSEIYKRYPGVNSVIHSHASEVIPYTISGVPLKPCYHMAGFLGSNVPIFDISHSYQENDTRNMLICNIPLGEALASSFSSGSEPAAAGASSEPEHCAALMRGHGFTVCGRSIQESVLRAVYTKENAAIQTSALLTHAAHYRISSSGSAVPDIAYLRPEEIEATTEMTRWSFMRPWKLWVREVEAAGLYVNNI